MRETETETETETATATTNQETAMRDDQFKAEAAATGDEMRAQGYRRGRLRWCRGVVRDPGEIAVVLQALHFTLPGLGLAHGSLADVRRDKVCMTWDGACIAAAELAQDILKEGLYLCAREPGFGDIAGKPIVSESEAARVQFTRFQAGLISEALADAVARHCWRGRPMIEHLARGIIKRCAELEGE